MIKTSRTGLFTDEARLDRLISASSQPAGTFYKALYAKTKGKNGGGGGGGGYGGGGGKKGPGDRGTSGRAKEGDLVGEGADRIGESNMGHKLLSMMGYVYVQISCPRERVRCHRLMCADGLKVARLERLMEV